MSWYDSLLADFCLRVGFASIDLQYRCKFRSVYEDRDGLVWTLEYRVRSRLDSGSSIGESASRRQLCLKFWLITMPIHLPLALRPSYWFPRERACLAAWCSRCLSIPCWILKKPAGLYWSRRRAWLRGLPFHGGHRHFVGAVDQCGHRGVVQSLRLSNCQVLEFQGIFGYGLGSGMASEFLWPSNISWWPWWSNIKRSPKASERLRSWWSTSGSIRTQWWNRILDSVGIVIRCYISYQPWSQSMSGLARKNSLQLQ